VTEALVVGASSGLGAAIARALLAKGYHVTAFSRTPPPPGTSHEHIECDVASTAAVHRALAQAPRVVDCLVYAAGEPVMGRTLAIPEDVAHSSLEVNFWGLDRVIRGVLPGMIERRRGTILAVLSLAALRAIPYQSYYASAKAAQARLLQCLAHEVKSSGVQIKYIAPGYIDTGFLTRQPWYGMRAPEIRGSGLTPDDLARRAIELIEGSDASRVVGWREKAICLADRLIPGLYDRILESRER